METLSADRIKVTEAKMKKTIGDKINPLFKKVEQQAGQAQSALKNMAEQQYELMVRVDALDEAVSKISPEHKVACANF